MLGNYGPQIGQQQNPSLIAGLRDRYRMQPPMSLPNSLLGSAPQLQQQGQMVAMPQAPEQRQNDPMQTMTKAAGILGDYRKEHPGETNGFGAGIKGFVNNLMGNETPAPAAPTPAALAPQPPAPQPAATPAAPAAGMPANFGDKMSSLGQLFTLFGGGGF